MDMTPKEEAEYKAEYRKMQEELPPPEPSLEQKIDSILTRMDEFEAQQLTMESRVQKLELASGGSVKPGGDIPFDPAPKPGGGLTIGG